MRVAFWFLLNFLIRYANSVHVSSSNEDDLNQNTPYMRQLLRLAKAAEIKSFMNTAADPCNNFYEFACGNYKNINPATILGVASTGSYESLHNGFNRKLQRILSTQQDSYDTPEDVQVKRFYESCTRITFNSYEQQIKELISEFGSMPLLVGDAWREKDFDWLDTTGRIARRYGVRAIIEAWRWKTGISLKPPKFSLDPPAEYSDKQSLSKYMNKIKDTLERNLGVESSLAQQTARELVDFEERLVQGIYKEKDHMSKIWLVDFGKPPPLDVNRLLNDTCSVFFTQNSFYIENLKKVMDYVPQRTVANYIFYYLVQNFLDFPTLSSSSIKKECVELTRRHIPNSLDNMFYRRNKKAVSHIEDIWHQIKGTFNRTLFSPKLSWIQHSTRMAAHAKLQNMTLKLLDYVEVNFTKQFDGLNLTSSNYFENLRQVKLFLTARQGEVIRKDNHFSASYLVYYNTLPVDFLQQYYFWADVYPKALMFGTIGYTFGHELVHGFSFEGREYRNESSKIWWDPQSDKNYLDREACFEKQYERYLDMKAIGHASENVADNEGLGIALAAYDAWSEGQKIMDSTKSVLDNERLPSLNFTAKQLFFISFAQKYCEDVHELLAPTPNTHAMGPVRVMGSVSNDNVFSKEFSCPEGSHMNPKEKCEMY